MAVYVRPYHDNSRFRLRPVGSEVTLTERIRALVEKSPGLSAWQMSKALEPQFPRVISGSVSSLLVQMTNRGELRRRQKWGTWVYYRRWGTAAPWRQ